MPRRYLSFNEAESALKRGKSIECFLGPCQRDGKPSIRWISINSQGNGVILRIYETADLGNEEFVDIYGFGPLNPNKTDGPDGELQFPDFASCIAVMEKRYPGSASCLVNEGVIQDEYADFVVSGRPQSSAIADNHFSSTYYTALSQIPLEQVCDSLSHALKLPPFEYDTEDSWQYGYAENG